MDANRFDELSRSPGRALQPPRGRPPGGRPGRRRRSVRPRWGPRARPGRRRGAGDQRCQIAFRSVVTVGAQRGRRPSRASSPSGSARTARSTTAPSRPRGPRTVQRWSVRPSGGRSTCGSRSTDDPCPRPERRRRAGRPGLPREDCRAPSPAPEFGDSALGGRAASAPPRPRPPPASGRRGRGRRSQRRREQRRWGRSPGAHLDARARRSPAPTPLSSGTPKPAGASATRGRDSAARSAARSGASATRPAEAASARSGR
jgi:hypothetical protein